MASNASHYSKPYDVYDNKKFAINECLKQFNDLTNAINEVCNQANMFGRCLQSLEELTMPEIVGQKRVKKIYSAKFNRSAHLVDSLDTFSKVMMSFSEKIKNEAIDSFDNFIMQAVLPNGDEDKAVHQHNSSSIIGSQIVNGLRDSFFSLYNHFMILAAELMEKFLICSDCSTPIGFPHQPLCLTEAMSVQNVWRKTKYDDKFITFGMNFCFNDIISPGCGKNILTKISNECLKQSLRTLEVKTSMPLTTKSWPERWMRGDKSSKSATSTKDKPDDSAVSVLTPYANEFFTRSIWAPKKSESDLLALKATKGFTNFNFHPEEFQ